MEVLAPLQEGASRAIKPVRDFGGWVGDAFSAKSDNKKLRKHKIFGGKDRCTLYVTDSTHGNILMAQLDAPGLMLHRGRRGV